MMSATVVGSDLAARSRVRLTTLAVPAALYLVALAVQAAVVLIVPFTLNEGSAYYVAVARNIAAGRGPVIDALWSYATPPLTLPRNAFELWQPLASYLAAAPMRVLGPNLSSAQVAFALFGALIAPLTWWIAADAAKRLALPADRQRVVAIGAGLLAAFAAPFVLAVAVPDSTLPFAVLGTAACVAMPAAARGNPRAVVVLGLLLGFAYLTRMEAVYLGAVFVVLAWGAGARGPQLLARVGSVALIGALVALPWWLRNVAVFGTPMPGQIVQNMFLTRNDQIFAFLDQPTPGAFLAQGPLNIAHNIGSAALFNLFGVLLVPGTVVAAVGLATMIAGRGQRSAVSGSPLAALLVYGAMAFAATAILFPVATLWGTFAHAAGPLFVGLTVLAVLGADAFVARVRQWRHWSRANLWLAPAALVALALPLTLVEVASAGQQASARKAQVNAAAAYVRSNPALDTSAPLITDQPIWLSDALGVPALALPDEGAQSVLQLARTFGASAVVVSQRDGTAVTGFSTSCFTNVAPPQGGAGATAEVTVLSIAEDCR